jgi:hypothetical protein
MARATIPKLVWGYASISSESLGTGDGVKTMFSGTLAQDQVKEKSLTITAGAQSVTDDGAGNLTGSGSGTINYVSGAYSVTFSSAPTSGTAVTAAYTYFPNTANLGQPLDNAIAYPVARQGSEWGQSSSGERDAWLLGHDQRLRGSVRHIPAADTTDPVATGWDGATGWAAFLEWARAMNAFRWYPEASDTVTFQTCYLVEPLDGEPALEENGDRVLDLVIEDTTGKAFTGY